MATNALLCQTSEFGCAERGFPSSKRAKRTQKTQPDSELRSCSAAAACAAAQRASLRQALKRAMRAFFFCLVVATVTAVPISRSPSTVVETREDACPRDADGRSCAGRGQCSLGFLCVCQEGWAGEACEEDACPRHCSGHGVCQSGVCSCQPGFAGAGCSVSLAPSPPPPEEPPRGVMQLLSGAAAAAAECPNRCSGRGRCDAGVCVCHPFQRGPDCSEAVCEPGCSEHGRCERGVCVCAAGWSGQQCEQAQCPGRCGAPSNGRCLVLASGDAHCLCARGWTGTGCLQSTCEGGCSGHGRCDGGRCACDGGTLNGPYPFHYP